MPPPFPFFRLPRELRDQIYCDVGGREISSTIEVYRDNLQDNHETLALLQLKAVAAHMPLENVLLVSRTFKHEYEIELRRHSTLRVMERPLDDFGYTAQRLIKHGPAHRCFRSIGKLEVRLEDYLGGSSPILEDSERIVRGFAPLMDNLKSIVCTFQFGLTGHESDPLIPGLSDTRTSAIAVSDLLTSILKKKMSHQTDDNVRIPVKNHLLLTCALFTVHMPFQPTSAELDLAPFFYQHIPEHHIPGIIQGILRNHITYAATLSTSEYNFLGLDLVTHEPAIVANQFTDFVREAELEF